MTVTQTSSSTDVIFAEFKRRAEAVSAEVHRFPGKAEALEFIVKYLEEAGVADQEQSYAVWAGDSFLDQADKITLAQRVLGLKFDVTREKAAAAKVGISQLDWAMASTGSLIQDAAAVEQRLVSTLPDYPCCAHLHGPVSSGLCGIVCADSAGTDQLHLLYHRAEPNGGH